MSFAFNTKMRDFTLKKYKVLIKAMVDQQFRFLNIRQAVSEKDLYSKEKIAIIRHDIDTKFDLPLALKMADFEAELNISASYYFRTIPDVFDREVIKSIYDMGHEIGYHYEVLSMTDGNFQKAIELFGKDLKILRDICPVSSICQHGGTLGPYSSTSIKGLFKTGLALLTRKVNMKYYPSIRLWDKYKLEDFDLTGDAYLSLDFEQIKYFSDTGMSWDSHATRIVDNVSEGRNAEMAAHSTDDLIALITDHKIDMINILVHPANWNDPVLKWVKWRTLQSIRNISKRIIKKSR